MKQKTFFSLLVFFLFSSFLTAQADLTIAIKCPGQALAGQELKKTIQVWVRNAGNLTAENIAVDLVLSSNASIPVVSAVYSPHFSDDVLLQGGREFISKLLPGQSLAVTLNGTNKIPADTPAGGYYLGAVVDTNKTVAETNENNNVAMCKIGISGSSTQPNAKLPDLGMYGFLKIGKNQRQVKWNETIILTPADATLISNGKPAFEVYYSYREYQGVAAAGFKNKLFFNGVVVSIQTNLAVTPSQIVPIHTQAYLGPENGQLKIHVDADNEVTESREDNNFHFTVNLIFRGFTQGQQGFGVPLQVAPANGSKFTHFPRTMNLKWNGVAGANAYDVEVDCLHCRQSGKWDTETGPAWKVANGLNSTQFGFTFVGDNQGRWRVRAVRGAQKSAWSPWWYFSFKTSGSPAVGKPDLIVSDIKLVEGCKIEVTLKNIGGAGVPADKYNLPNAVAVQMYNGDQPWGGIILSGFDANGYLKSAGGSASWIWFPRAANLNLTPGIHSIQVEVDSNKKLDELSESNNMLTKRLSCQPASSAQPCGIQLQSLSKNQGYVGNTFTMIGTWGSSQGTKLPCINMGSMNRLIVLRWTPTALEVKIPAGLVPGKYRVGVYCKDPALGTTYSSGWLDFTILSGAVY